MRRICICLLAALVLSFSACGQSAPPESSAVSISPAEKQETAISPPPSSEEPESSAAASPESPSSQEGSSTLIAYFSRAWAAWKHGIGAGEAGCQKGVSFLKYAVSVLLCGYGISAFIKRQLGTYMLLKSTFVFFDFSEPLALFLLDHAAIMAMIACLGHYMAKLLSYRKL